MNHCRDCKHWKPFDDALIQRIPQYAGIGICGAVTNGIGVETPIAFVTVDGGMEDPELNTSHDFGCVLWAPKET